MKKILRSTVIAAASMASMLSIPHGKEEGGRHKKQRAQAHPKRAPKTASPAGLAGAGPNDGNTASNEVGDSAETAASAEAAAVKVAQAAMAKALAQVAAEIPRKDALPILPAENREEPVMAAMVEQPAATSKTAAKQAPAADKYPWRRDIVTTTFWIGEKPTKNNPTPNRTSAWDKEWAAHFGGTDTPVREDRRDFRPAGFVPGQNPFYVALPYNDLQASGHKPEARKVVPWFDDEYRASNQSVCKGRWVAIRFKGRTVYAQWEDCGPFRTDHAGYVFGDERPKKNINKGAGLDVSPAVRDCLGMDDTDVTDWKFVDFEEVPEGPWAKYGENNTFVIARRLNELRIATLANDRRGHE